MKIHNSINMGKPCEDGSRHEKMGHKGSLAAFGAMILAACTPANADKVKPQEVQIAAVERANTNTVTRSQCLAFDTKIEKITCLKQLSAQRKAEIAAKKEQRQANADEQAASQARIKTKRTDNAARTGRIETKISDNAAKTKERDQVNTTNEVLSNEIKEVEKRIEARVTEPNKD